MTKRKVNPKKIIKISIIVSVVIIVIIGGLFAFKTLSKEKPVEEEKKVIDNVLDYTLDDNETDYYKNLFSQLKQILNQSNINEEEYAKIIAQLFVTDFFNLDNKINKNDIGGTQFIYKDFQNDFEKSARDTIYNHLENNIYGDRKQELPVVHSATVKSTVQKKYKYNDQTDNEAYYIDLLIKYEKDMGYQEEVSLIIIHDNDKLEIAEMK